MVARVILLLGALADEGGDGGGALELLVVDFEQRGVGEVAAFEPLVEASCAALPLE